MAKNKLGIVNPNSETSGMDALSSLYTSPEEEERLRRSSVAKQRLLAFGDALRHIGNIYHTVNYAPSQKLTSPVVDEVARYERGKALRDAANMKYYSYQQAKAAQDAKQRQWEATFAYNAERDAARLKAQRDYQNAMVSENIRNHDLTHSLGRARLDETMKNNEANRKIRERQVNGQLALGARRVSIAQQNANSAAAYRNYKMNGGGGGGGNPYPLPTKNGFITLGRDLNTNQVGKKALFGELKRAGIINDVWQKRYENMYTPQEQSALLNTAISQWLMTDDNAADYMRIHFGANYVGAPQSAGYVVNSSNSSTPPVWNSPWAGYAPGGSAPSDGGLTIGWDDDDDELDNDLEIGW